MLLEASPPKPPPPVTFGLAPMEGVTDFPVRLWFGLAVAPDFLCTPFLRATATFPGKRIPTNFVPELVELRGAAFAPLVVQIMASDNEHFEAAATHFLPLTDAVDINCGCPAPSPFAGGAGSSLLADAATFVERQTDLARRLGPRRLGIKMRTGIDDDEGFEAMVQGLRDLPLRRVTIHGRTKRAQYKGKADWTHIGRAAQHLAVDVIGSGDVNDAATLAERLQLAQAVKTVIVGRGALRNPWIFDELRTGKSVLISKEALIGALAVFAILHEFHFTAPERLLEVAAPLAGRKLGSEGTAWQNLFEELTGTTDPFALPFARRTLGRTKQLWSYLRSSLPEPYFEPRLLRSKTVGELLRGIAAVPLADDPLPLVYRPELDWLYAGEAKPQ